MPIAVNIVENVAVWFVKGDLSLQDLHKAFAQTAVVRESYPKNARLFLVWTAKVPQAVREEITRMHARTSEIFERIVCYGPPQVLAAITVRCVLSGKFGVGIEGGTKLRPVLEYVSHGLPSAVQLKINRLESEIRVLAPHDF